MAANFWYRKSYKVAKGFAMKICIRPRVIAEDPTKKAYGVFVSSNDFFVWRVNLFAYGFRWILFQRLYNMIAFGVFHGNPSR